MAEINENYTADAFGRGNSNGYIADISALGAILNAKDVAAKLDTIGSTLSDDFNHLDMGIAGVARDIVDNRAKIAEMIASSQGVLGTQSERIGAAQGVQAERIGAALGIQSEKIGSALGIQGEKIGAAVGVQIEKVASAIGIQNEKIATDSQVQVEKVAAALALQIEKTSASNELQAEKLAAAAVLQAERVASASVLLMHQIAATAAAKQAECCCELKEKICHTNEHIDHSAGETRHLIAELARRDCDRRESDLKIDLSNSRQNEHMRHMLDDVLSKKHDHHCGRYYDSHDYFDYRRGHGHDGHDGHGHDGHDGHDGHGKKG